MWVRQTVWEKKQINLLGKWLHHGTRDTHPSSSGEEDGFLWLPDSLTKKKKKIPSLTQHTYKKYQIKLH